VLSVAGAFVVIGSGAGSTRFQDLTINFVAFISLLSMVSTRPTMNWVTHKLGIDSDNHISKKFVEMAQEEVGMAGYHAWQGAQVDREYFYATWDEVKRIADLPKDWARMSRR
jgi:hypothetical protein